MDTVTILGFEYPRHPSATHSRKDTRERLRSAVASLEFAMSQMGMADRSAYLAIVRAHAQVRARLAEAEAARVLDGPRSIFESSGRML